jgi:hypothetical protein
MRKYNFLLTCTISVILLSMQACVESDLPVPENGDPVFLVNGTLADEPFEVVAGIDDRALKPEFVYDENEVLEYKASFNHAASDVVYPDQLVFTFRSSTAGTGSPAIDTDLSPGLFTFYRDEHTDSTIRPYVFTSTIENGFPPFEYLWEFGNGIISTEANPEVAFNTDDPFTTVKLQVWDVFGKHASYATDFLPDAAPLKANFYTSPSVSDVVVNLDVSGGVPPYTHNWNVTNNNAIVFSMPAVSVLLDSICLTVNDEDNNTTEVCKMLADPSSGTLFSAIYDYEKKIIPVDLQLSTVTIDLTDDFGKLYSSSFGEQPDTAFLEILENEAYDNYTDGHKTRRLKIRYSCLLFSEDGESKSFSGEGYIGVAYP